MVDLLVVTEISYAYPDAVFHAGDVLRKWRYERGFKVEDLATKARVDKNTITRAESGAPLKTNTVQALVTALGHTMRQFHEVQERLSVAFDPAFDAMTRERAKPITEPDPIADLAPRLSDVQREAVLNTMRVFLQIAPAAGPVATKVTESTGPSARRRS